MTEDEIDEIRGLLLFAKPTAAQLALLDALGGERVYPPVLPTWIADPPHGPYDGPRAVEYAINQINSDRTDDPAWFLRNLG